MWALWCLPVTVMISHSQCDSGGHLDCWPRGLSFSYLAGIGASSWKNIVKDFETLAHQEKKALGGSPC